MIKYRASLIARAALAACIALGTGAPAMAAGNGDSGSVTLGNGNAQSSHVSDQDLRKFGAAYVHLRSIRATYVKKLQKADGKKEQVQIKKQGQKKMVQAIRDQDLKVAEYQQIGRKLNGDKALQQRLRKIMHQSQQDDASDS